MKNYQLFAKFFLCITILGVACQQENEGKQEGSSQVKADSTLHHYDTTIVEKEDKPNDTTIVKQIPVVNQKPQNKLSDSIIREKSLQKKEDNLPKQLFDKQPTEYDKNIYTLGRTTNGKWYLIEKKSMQQRHDVIPDHRIKPMNKTKPAIGKK